MILSANCTRAVPGKFEQYGEVMQDFMAAMMELGMTPSMKVAEVGAQDVEVYLMSMHQDMREYGKMSDAMRESDAFKAAYQKAAVSGAVQLVDSFNADLLPGFDVPPGPATGVIAASAWKPFPGKVAQLIQGFGAAKAIHEKHGATVRAWQVMGGRWTGCLNYTISVDNMAALGDVMEDSREEYLAMLAVAGLDPSAEIVAQRIMNNPLILN